RRAARLEDLDPVAGREVLQRRIGGAGCGGGAVAAVHEHQVAVHAAQVNAGRGDEHARPLAALLVVDAGPEAAPASRAGAREAALVTARRLTGRRCPLPPTRAPMGSRVPASPTLPTPSGWGRSVAPTVRRRFPASPRSD